VITTKSSPVYLNLISPRPTTTSIASILCSFSNYLGPPASNHIIEQPFLSSMSILMSILFYISLSFHVFSCFDCHSPFSFTFQVLLWRCYNRCYCIFLTHFLCNIHLYFEISTNIFVF